MWLNGNIEELQYLQIQSFVLELRDVNASI